MGNRFVQFTDAPQINLTAQTTDFTTTPIEIQMIRNLSIQAIWTETGSSGASVTPQVSNDGVNYSNVLDSSGSPLTVAISSDSSYIWEISTNCRWLRLNVPVAGGTLDTFKVFFGLKDT